MAGPHLVVTNAHVVAGESDTTVQVDGNPPGLDADVIDFDSARRRGGAARARPARAGRCSWRPTRRPGTPAAILGYPLDGGFDVEPGRIGQTETVSTEDAYGNGPVLRSITALRGRVRPGNSGGPMVDGAGQVVATVFAAITGSPSGEGGFAVPERRSCAERLAGGRAHATHAGADRPGRAPGLVAEGSSRSGRQVPLLGRAVVCTPPAPRCMPPGAPKVLLPPDVLGHLTHHPGPQCPQQLGMVVSEVSLSR